VATGPLDPAFEYGNKADVSDIGKLKKKFRPNPKRQLILVVLALIGLGVGYGLGFVFKRPEPAPIPAPVQPAAPAPVSQSSEPVNASPPAPAAEPDVARSPVLPEAHDTQPTKTVRAYEEALPREIIVIMEPLTPKALKPAKAPAPTPSKPTTAEPPKETASAPLVEPETKPVEGAPAPPMSLLPVKPGADAPAWRRNAVVMVGDGRPQVAIVMDDLGIDRARTLRTMHLRPPLTLSFLAYAHELQHQAETGRKSGHEIWLHVPMEPGSTTIDPGPNVLLTSVPPGERAKSLNWNLDQLTGFVGINNHMGSRFTASPEGMRGVMTELKKRGLAFLDSMTTPKSYGHIAAKEAGVPFTLRNVFLDHEDNQKAVEAQLHKLEALARKHGHALAIGHPREATLAALGPWLRTLDAKGLQLVPASAFLREPQEQLAKQSEN
jgi:polysaccharide deacetylase 2 family uncharacterized protein YibQ